MPAAAPSYDTTLSGPADPKGRSGLPGREWTRRVALSRLLLLTLLNCGFTLVLGRSYLAAIPEGTSAAGWLAALLAFVSTTTTFNAAALAACAPFVLLLNRRWVLLTVCPLLFAVVQVFIAADAVIYGLFHFHFNGMILNLLTAPGASDTLTLGPATEISALLTILVICAVEWVLGWLTLRQRMAPFVGLRWMLPIAGALLAATAADKALYAYGDLSNRAELTRAGHLFPLYQRVTIKGFARQHGVDVVRRNRLDHLRAGTMLRYPKAVELPAQVRPLNIIVVAIEGWRFDMLDPEVMPRLYAWSTSQLVYRNHYSGGNASRSGIFSLLYGIYGTYWHTVLAERQGPFLIHALKRLGYQFQIDSCTDLNFPEFRQTAFVEVPEAIHDQWPGQRVDRDRAMTSAAIAFLDRSPDPFFLFMFYDASHATYVYPPEDEKFLPVVARDRVNFLKISGHVSAEALRPLFNRYRNSLHYIDSQLGRLLDALQRKGLLDNTLVFITGDHGEEFGELGYYGHNSTFDRYQAQVAMVAHVPGRAAGSITHLTSHLDVVPTILQAIGVRTPIEAYSQGLPLITDAARDHVMVASWDQVGLVDGDTTTVIGTESYNPSIQVYDHDYHQLTDAGAKLATQQSMLRDLVRGMGEFSR